MPPTSQYQSTTQKYLDIYDITNNFVILKTGFVSFVLSVSAMNFGLLAEAEQDAVIYTYASLLNSLNYPVQIVIQSQTKDVTDYLNLLKQQETEASSDQKRERIARYRQFVSQLIKERNVLDKKFYVVGSATPSELGLITADSVLPGKTEFDITKFEKSVILEKTESVLDPRRDHLISQFARIGLFARQLNTQEIIRIFYTSYNPEASEGQEVTDTQQYTTPLVRASLVKQTQPLTTQPLTTQPQNPTPPPAQDLTEQQVHEPELVEQQQTSPQPSEVAFETNEESLTSNNNSQAPSQQESHEQLQATIQQSSTDSMTNQANHNYPTPSHALTNNQSNQAVELQNNVSSPTKASPASQTSQLSSTLPQDSTSLQPQSPSVPEPQEQPSPQDLVSTPVENNLNSQGSAGSQMPQSPAPSTTPSVNPSATQEADTKPMTSTATFQENLDDFSPPPVSKGQGASLGNKVSFKKSAFRNSDASGSVEEKPSEELSSTDSSANDQINQDLIKEVPSEPKSSEQKTPESKASEQKKPENQSYTEPAGQDNKPLENQSTDSRSAPTNLPPIAEIK